MTLQRVLILLMFIVGSWSACSAQGKILAPTASDSANWKEFSSAEGRFSVLFPGTPVSKVTEAQTSAGNVNFNAFTLKLPEAFYQVSYLVYPNYSEDPEFSKRSLNAGRDGMFARNRGTELLAEKEITIGNFPGREFLMLQDRFSFGIMRAFVIRDRLYEVAILVPVDTAFRNGRASTRPEDRTESFNSTSSRFFDSFEVTDVIETLDEVDRMARELTRKNQGLVTMASSADAGLGKATGGVINGRALRLVTPAYPAIARSAHASGSVSVKVLIDLEGNVAAAAVVDGHPLLRSAAIKAARDSKFTATRLEGKPVFVMGIIIYNFFAQ